MLLRTSIAIVVSAVAGTILVALISGAWPSSLLGGTSSLLGSSIGLVLMHRALSRKEETARAETNRLLGSFVAAMVVRVVLLASSLAFLMVVLGWEPLSFIAAFFLGHLAGQILEIRYMHRSRQVPAALPA